MDGRWADGHLRPTLLGRLGGVDLKIALYDRVHKSVISIIIVGGGLLPDFHMFVFDDFCYCSKVAGPMSSTAAVGVKSSRDNIGILNFLFLLISGLKHIHCVPKTTLLWLAIL